MKTILMALVVAVSGVAMAQETPVVSTTEAVATSPVAVSWRDQERLVTSFTHRRKTVNIYELGRVTSTTIDRDQFAQELGEAMMTKTNELNVEVCATFCQANNSQGWAGVITTAHARAACPVVDLCPKGYTATKYDMHSHVDGTSYAPTEIDRVFLMYDYENVRKVKTYAFDFSGKDLDKPFGYLVHSRGVMYQEGKGRTRRIHWED